MVTHFCDKHRHYQLQQMRGDLVVWLKPVAVARAVARRDGRVQAAGHPADHARLGVAEGGWMSCARCRA